MSHSATKNSSRKKKVFVEKADELYKRMSVAKAELETLRDEKKNVEKNRAFSSEKQKAISSARLFNCMETNFIRDKKQDKVRSLNY